MLESASMLVGERSLMNYATAYLTLFHGDAEEVGIKARGYMINKVVSNIGTDQLQPENGPKSESMSMIEITLTC